MTSFAVLTPSRGLVHSRTVEAVMVAIDMATAAGHDFRGWRLSHDLPIPDCHNAVTAAGLATGAEALWFVEEDVVPPADAFLALLAVGAPIAALDYPVRPKGGPLWSCVNRDRDGRIVYCGLGCTLIARSVFERLPEPWFRSDTQFRITRFGDVRTVLEPVNAPYEYGGQDIYFCKVAQEAGFPIVELAGRNAAHAKLVELGRTGSNDGAHAIEVLDHIERWQGEYARVPA